eukprot:s1625_g18.t1
MWGYPVLAFMWLRTAMNYQYKFGGTLLEVLKKLWDEGGLLRLYQGIFPWAIFQAPLSRFGDVAANDMVLVLFQQLMPQVPVSMATFMGSLSSAAWRIIITPVDTCKTILQTDGAKGWVMLKDKIQKGGPLVLWAGWEGNYMANVVGNYPWFATMNVLQKHIPVPAGNFQKLVRSAFIGAIASSISDVVANSIRVIKTKKQTSSENCSYLSAAQQIIEKDAGNGKKSTLEKWSGMRRTSGESIPQLLVREEELFVELQRALKRAREERAKAETRSTGVGGAERDPSQSPSRSPPAGVRGMQVGEPADETGVTGSVHTTDGSMGGNGFFEDESVAIAF